MTRPSDAIAAMGDSDKTSSDADDGSTTSVEETVATQEAAEGADSSGMLGSRSGLQEAMLSTEPETPLSAVDSPWNPEEGGITRVYRGLMKATGVSGLPALVDIVIGAAEFVQDFEPEMADNIDDQDTTADEQQGSPDIA